MEESVGFFATFMNKISSILAYTKLDEQFDKVDYMGLLTNPFFLVPAIIFIVYMIYKQNFKDLLIISILVGVWIFTGTDYAQSLTNENGEMEAARLLPVAGGGAVVLGFLIYLLFGRSD